MRMPAIRGLDFWLEARLRRNVYNAPEGCRRLGRPLGLYDHQAQDWAPNSAGAGVDGEEAGCGKDGRQEQRGDGEGDVCDHVEEHKEVGESKASILSLGDGADKGRHRNGLVSVGGRSDGLRFVSLLQRSDPSCKSISPTYLKLRSNLRENPGADQHPEEGRG